VRATPYIERSIGWHLEQRATQEPGRIAIVQGDRSLTYGALDHAAENLALAIQLRMRTAPAPPALPAPPARPVVLLLDHGVDVAAGAIGVLKAGGIVAPLDPSSDAERLRAQLDYLDPSVILTSAERASKVHEIAGVRPLLLIEDAAGFVSGDRPASDASFAGGDTPAWLYHTSGMTGRPKAVVVSHRMLLRGLAANRQRLGLRDSDRFTWFGLASTSQGGSNMLGALLAGGTLYPHAPRLDGLAGIPDLLRRERITVYNSSATLFRAIVSVLAPEDRLPDLRVLRVGSERVRRDDFEAYKRHCPRSCIFVNRYSSTETGSIAVNRLDHDSRVDGSCVPVGTALEGKHIVILDTTRQPVTHGEVGEIAVQGEDLALGYWRNETATRAAFLDVEGAPTERRYLTGDLGRLLPDGTLEHLGRTDRRVKIRGQRVELDEIEDALARHPAVAEAVVCVAEGPDAEDRLEAYTVNRPGTNVDGSALRSWLAAFVPPAGIPASFTALESLPMTASGKIDRVGLRPEAAKSGTNAADTAPLNDIEQELLIMWSDVLRVPVMRADDDFLALGGDSLHAMRILARVQDRWGVALSFEQLLDCGTVSALASAIVSPVRPD